jgi:hypothetical protein
MQTWSIRCSRRKSAKCALFIRQVCPNPVGHHDNERAIIHIQPVRAADKFIATASYERAVDILAQVWLVKMGHGLFPFEAEDICNDIIRIVVGKYKVGHSVVT